MITEVTSFKTSDGSVFPSRDYALQYEREFELSAELIDGDPGLYLELQQVHRLANWLNARYDLVPK